MVSMVHIKAMLLHLKMTISVSFWDKHLWTKPKFSGAGASLNNSQKFESSNPGQLSLSDVALSRWKQSQSDIISKRKSCHVSKNGERKMKTFQRTYPSTLVFSFVFPLMNGFLQKKSGEILRPQFAICSNSAYKYLIFHKIHASA